MKNILITIFLIFSMFILGFSQHEEEHLLPKDSSVIDSLIPDKVAKNELLETIAKFYSQGDSGKVNVAIINVPPSFPTTKEDVKKEREPLNFFTWWKFFLSALFFFGLYFLLKFLSRVLTKYNFLGNFQGEVKGIINNSLLIFEAAALLILGGAFILINPIYHGILAVIILAAGFNHIKNYFSGRIVQFDQAVEEGKRLRTLESQGVIFKKGRLGIKLRTPKGVQFINYSSLISNGYTLLSGVEIGGFYELEIQPKDQDGKKDYLTILKDLFTTTPYLDMSHRPQLAITNEDTNTIMARVEVKEESHLQDLVTLIKEWNFSCKIVS